MENLTNSPKRSASIISLYFSNAHASHMIALAKLLQTLGFAITFIVDERYLRLADFSAIGETVTTCELSGHPIPLTFDLAVFCNCATTNHRLIANMRTRGTVVLYVFHEPGQVLSWKYFVSEGWRQTVRFVISSCFNIVTVRRSTGVIVPSSHALALYRRHYLKHNENVHIMPLLFDDEIGNDRFERAQHNKLHFGFVGKACKSHGFDFFLKFAKYAVRSESSIQFLISTKVDLSSLLASDKELARLAREGRIQIQHGRDLRNEEINEHYLSCFCIWGAYRRSTQSGVMASAFMAGSAVLATRVGSFPEYVVPGFNGEFADSIGEFNTLLRLAEKIQRDIPTYSQGCRNTFLETFYYPAHRVKFMELINSCVRESQQMRVASVVPHLGARDGKASCLLIDHLAIKSATPNVGPDGHPWCGPELHAPTRTPKALSPNCIPGRTDHA